MLLYSLSIWNSVASSAIWHSRPISRACARLMRLSPPSTSTLVIEWNLNQPSGTSCP